MANSSDFARFKRIAFFGLGKMGLPMARQLHEAGAPVVGFDSAETARVAFADAGGTVAASAREATAGADVLITMLPDGKSVRAALLEGEPVVAHCAPDAIVLDMSSSAPVETREFADELAQRGIRLLDAPVSGGVKRAVDGSLAIMVGGPPEAVAKVRPLLETMGKSIFETGAVGSGHAMKALNNYVSAAGLTAACEALQIGEKFGLDPMLMTDVLNASTGRNNSTEVKLKPFVIPKNYASGFSLGLMTKDLRTADDLARYLDVPAPFSQALIEIWQDAADALSAAADHTAIDEYLATARKRYGRVQ
ncbi:MAG: NAD(P)-dependent oxidoreductase [Methylobacteriaceae bacterium]|nr:NAD(P)-dependent oxidoreductase [Methylobacteriaceae bacterium]